MNEPMFEVALTSHNRPEMLKRAVFSVLGQTHKPVRLWVLDNSNEHIWSGIQDWFKDLNLSPIFGSVRHWPEVKGMAPYAWLINQVFPMFGTNSWVSYLTDDAWYPPDRFEKFAQALAANPQAQAFYGEQVRINKGSKKFPVQGGVLHLEVQDHPVRSEELNRRNWIDHCSVVHKASLIAQDKEPWNTDIGVIRNGDWHTWRKLITRADIYPVPHVVAFDEWHPGGLNS